MANDDPVGRREFDMLARQVSDNAQRLDRIDAGGTRGVAVLQLQISDLAKDFAAHEKMHEIGEARQISRGRWLGTLIVTMIAALLGNAAAMIAVLGVGGHG